ncbi:hypothetical protein QYF61_005671 [Mycteria americana]|uniref:Uncharacterized protein n=1 Tax=Mycteria americana TaxID=33587 RepID=A0AAN7N526_MYCAM|nr:hypothetical protein QYF61_005671 [Mycteria americana]
MRKANTLNAFFISLFTDKTIPQQPQVPEIMKEDQVRKHLNKLDIHKSMGHNKMHPHVVRELADVIKRDKKAFGSSEHGYTKGKLCLTNLIAFHDEKVDPMDKERTLSIAYLDSNNTCGCGSAAPNPAGGQSSRHTPGVNTRSNTVQQLIKNLQGGTECSFSKFTDNTKLRVEKWANSNLMKFNKGKYKVLPLARIIPCTLAETDLRDNELAARQQCALTAKKAHSNLGCIRKSITSRLKEVILLLYSALVSRPECWAQSWAPQYETGLLEQAQQKVITGGQPIAQMIAESPSLEILKIQPDIVLGNVLYVDRERATRRGLLFPTFPTLAWHESKSTLEDQRMV